jgi:formylglycine-generating enzyme required for sulfatase activity
MRSLLFLACVLILQMDVFAAPPAVTNVVAVQRVGTKLVDIRYDLSDAEGDLVKVRIEISNDGGRTYSVPANSLIGDIGGGILPGTNKLIVWNAGIDWDGEFSETMRVKVIASDGKGFPGLEWGQEIPPGGFFMGKDGGPEGVGLGRHVSIPWSYWMSKYEITVEQFTEFLNTTLAAGYTRRSDNGIYANQGMFIGVPKDSQLYNLGDDISWNLNKLVVAQGREKLPVIVPWFGALAFAGYYGYDLPTDAEWEKATRGPDHDGLGEHWIYPWGNGITGANGSFRGQGNPFSGTRTPVGLFQGSQSPGGLDMGNAYGLYDLIGNVAEWTRSENISLESYPPIESLANAIHSYDRSVQRVTRGGSYDDSTNSPTLTCFYRSNFGYTGIRVVRRAQP